MHSFVGKRAGFQGISFKIDQKTTLFCQIKHQGSSEPYPHYIYASQMRGYLLKIKDASRDQYTLQRAVCNNKRGSF